MSSSACDVVKMTTGMTRNSGSAFSSASTSRPSRRGRLRSSRIRPGRGAPAYSPSWRRNCSACSPSFTTCSWLWILWCSKASRVISTSPGSSSTSSTSTTRVWALSAIGILVLGEHGQGEPETGPCGDRGVEPDPATVILDDLLYHGQAYSRAGIGGLVVQALEDHEDPVCVLRSDPDPIVAEGEQPVVAVAAGRHRDPWRLIRAELQRVVEQVLERGGEQRGLTEHHRQLTHLEGGVRPAHFGREVRPRLGEQHRAGR